MTPSMTIPKTKLWNVASKDRDRRPILTAVHFDAKANCLVATDGFILAAVPVEADGNEGMSANIPAETVKAAVKLAKRKGDEPALIVNDDNTATPFVARGGPWGEPLPLVDGKYPDYNVIIPKNNTFAVALDVNNLLRVAEAICENGDLWVELHLGTDPTQPIVVKPLERNPSGRVGVVMPMYKST